VNDLRKVAPAFVEIAHGIVWATVATVDRRNRPRSRIVHPLWEWDGERLTGWVATSPTPLKRAHLEHSPYASVNYWSPAQDVATAECRAELSVDDATREFVWRRFTELPEPLGYDPGSIPPWKDGPTSARFAVLRLDPWRLRVFPAVFGASGGAEGELLTWQASPAPA
jgi:hypothetical protein